MNYISILFFVLFSSSCSVTTSLSIPEGIGEIIQKRNSNRFNAVFNNQSSESKYNYRKKLLWDLFSLDRTKEEKYSKLGRFVELKILKDSLSVSLLDSNFLLLDKREFNVVFENGGLKIQKATKYIFLILFNSITFNEKSLWLDKNDNLMFFYEESFMGTAAILPFGVSLKQTYTFLKINEKGI